MMDIKVLEPSVFLGENITAFFTLKNEQLSDNESNILGLNLGYNTDESPEVVSENRNRLFKTFNLNPDWVALANQVHSNRVKVVTNGGTFAETDGLITQIPGLALAIQVADCAAVLIADPITKTIAAVHAGWRGAAGDIIPRTLGKMSNLRAQLTDCKAFISPCISLDNFEVGQEVADQFPDEFVDYESYEKPHVDLKQFLAHQLTEAGLKSANIEVHPRCTMQDDAFYSYRREKDKSGRMMGIIQLAEVL